MSILWFHWHIPFSLFLLNLLCFILFTSLGFFLTFQNLPVSSWWLNMWPTCLNQAESRTPEGHQVSKMYALSVILLVSLHIYSEMDNWILVDHLVSWHFGFQVIGKSTPNGFNSTGSVWTSLIETTRSSSGFKYGLIKTLKLFFSCTSLSFSLLFGSASYLGCFHSWKQNGYTRSRHYLPYTTLPSRRESFSWLT